MSKNTKIIFSVSIVLAVSLVATYILLRKKTQGDSSVSVKQKNDKKEENTTEQTTLLSVAMSVIRGDYGVGNERKVLLEAAGYDYSQVQALVNQILNNN